MEFDGLKISTPKSEKKDENQGKVKPEQKLDNDANTANRAESKDDEERGSDFQVEGTFKDEAILQKLKEVKLRKNEEIIYGIYNNADKSIYIKLNDFLIDRSKVTLKDKSYFFHMLAVMVDAGIPVVRAVKALAYRTTNPRFSRVLFTVSHNCETGTSLSDAMSRFSDVFDEAELGIVKSGEATGRLNKMLFKLSSQLDDRHDLNMKLWSASVYPIVVLGVLLVVAVAMLVWIFPTLLNLLKEGGVFSADLPLATRILITLQGVIVNFWWLILLVMFGGYGIFSLYKNSDFGANRWDFLKLKIPVVGTLLRKLYVLRFVGMMGILIDSGLPVIRALKITGSSISNRIYKMKTQEVINNVRVGKKISESLEDSEFLFAPDVVQMIRVGESSASLGATSQKIADQYQREIDNSIKKLSSVFEPVMILIVGVFVALLALAIMAPIFNLSSAVG